MKYKKQDNEDINIKKYKLEKKEKNYHYRNKRQSSNS